MSPMLVSPFTSFGSGTPSSGLTEPWGELGRSSTITSGAITVSGLTLTSVSAIQVLLLGLHVTTDDSLVQIQWLVAGSLVTTGYRWACRRHSSAVNLVGSTSDSSIHLTEASASTHAVGNAAEESLGGWIYLPGPAAGVYKAARFETTHQRPDTVLTVNTGGGLLEDTGAVTGVKVLASSDLTAGEVVVLGME